MAGGHIGEELLGRFLRAEVSREEAQQVLRHLLSRCPECLALSSRRTAELGLYSKTTTWEEAYEEVFAQALAFATQEEERLRERDSLAAVVPGMRVASFSYMLRT